MWASIISEKEISIQAVAKELAARGWTLVSDSIQDVEAKGPEPLLVWMLFNPNSLLQKEYTCQGFVRIATTGKVDRTFFYVISDSWLIRMYHQAVMALWMAYYKLKHRWFSKPESR